MTSIARVIAGLVVGSLPCAAVAVGACGTTVEPAPEAPSSPPPAAEAPPARAASDQRDARATDFQIALGAYRLDPRDHESVIPASLRAPPGACEAEPCYYIVQLFATMTGDTHARLTQDLGLELREYVPNLAYVEHLSPDERAAVCADPSVRACLPYQPAFKLAPDLRDPPHVLHDDRPVVVATLFATATPDAVTADLEALGADVLGVNDDRPIGGALRVRFSIQGFDRLEDAARIAAIRWIEKEGRLDEDRGPR